MSQSHDAAIASVWTLHLACGHVRTFHDPDGKGAPLGTASCDECDRRVTITRRFKDGHETC